MKHDYTKIFSGNPVLSRRIIEGLEQIGIVPIVKDQSGSSRMAGFPSAISEDQDIYVQNAETGKAKPIIDQILTDVKA